MMKQYVEFNSLHRAQVRNDFDIDFYKLLSNSLFGKMIENPDKRMKVKLCRTREELERSIAKATFKRSKIIDPKLVGGGNEVFFREIEQALLYRGCYFGTGQTPHVRFPLQ